MARGKHATAAARRREDAAVQAEIDDLHAQIRTLTKELEVLHEEMDKDQQRHRALVERIARERDEAAGPEVERLRALSDRLITKRSYREGHDRGSLEFYRKALNTYRQRAVDHFQTEHGMTGDQAMIAAGSLIEWNEPGVTGTASEALATVSLLRLGLSDQ